MYELIKIENTTIGDESVPTINARELYEFLESKRGFSKWIKERISHYDFIENQDYICLGQNCPTQTSSGKQGVSFRYEYFLTLDMAKELAMIERNQKGKEARKYFIECEKKLKDLVTSKERYLLDIVMADNVRERAIAMNEYEVGYVQPLEQFKEQALPKVDIYDAIIESRNTFSMANTAQIINIEKMGRNKLMAWLRSEKVLKNDNTPYQKYINNNWFEVRLTSTVNGVKACSRATPKGIEGILRLLGEHT